MDGNWLTRREERIWPISLSFLLAVVKPQAPRRFSNLAQILSSKFDDRSNPTLLFQRKNKLSDFHRNIPVRFKENFLVVPNILSLTRWAETLGSSANTLVVFSKFN
jgi:hypothetical protein